MSKRLCGAELRAGLNHSTFSNFSVSNCLKCKRQTLWIKGITTFQATRFSVYLSKLNFHLFSSSNSKCVVLLSLKNNGIGHTFGEHKGNN